MNRDFQGGGGSPRVPQRSDLPRGQVTFLFTDIEGSTRLAQMLGEGYRPVLHEHRRVLRAALATAGGVELFTEGDSYFFVFAEAAHALQACAAAQRALAQHPWDDPKAQPRVRMGLHTGVAHPHGGEYASPEVHRAARVAAAAHGGQILLSASTAEAACTLPDQGWLLDLGLHRLRGFDGRERLYQLVAPGLEQHFPRPRTEHAAPHNLPNHLTSFVGRRGERAELGSLLAEHRLVTVVGAGGAGKTRLAVAVAGDLVESHPDGVWSIDLATVTDPGLVAFTVATVLGLRPEPGRPVTETLADFLSTRRMLLLLDTCEAHLSAVVPLLARLLAGAAEVTVLATSREPLGLPGELVWRIPPLSLTADGEDGTSDAVALLAQRTVAARGGRPIEPAELAGLARVAARLDGLPLAIELAAARLRVLSAGELAGRLHAELTADEADPLLALDAGGNTAAAHPRHATMQATVTWSYRTLPEDAARLLRWLSVFAGPVGLSGVEALLDADPLGPLTVLVDKSLVQAEPGPHGTTYRMLDPIRGYAARRLTEHGEEAAARDRHVAWALAELREVHHGPDAQPVTLSLYSIDPLAAELRAALRWCGTGGSARDGLRLSCGLDQWWRERGLAREGRLWLFRLYARLSETGEPVPDAELARVYHAHSGHAAVDGEFAEELRFSRRAEASARRAGDPRLLARVLAGRSGALRDAGQPADAEKACREVIEWAERHDVASDALFAVCNLAELLWLRGALDEAADLLAASRQLEQLRPAERGRRTLDLLLGMVALRRGDLVAAHEHLTVALRSRMAYGFHGRACVAIKAMAARCVQGGDARIAAVLFGAAESTTVKLHCGPGIFAAYWTAQQESARAALGDAAFDEAYAEGAALSLGETATLALAVEHPDLSVDSGRFAELPAA
ncbi:adenylate/guanylate cyclase domain-containing protein [Catellatospora sp. NEAU-YM18]|nr:adenylate/guanylate cyclase domain-containing protein [Catellatospora tritici]MBV1849897.1 adenylate/guanylate cyclase domain-containing protein [Catellatospora tritici]